jgi:hypothetical protein
MDAASATIVEATFRVANMSSMKAIDQNEAVRGDARGRLPPPSQWGMPCFPLVHMRVVCVRDVCVFVCVRVVCVCMCVRVRSCVSGGGWTGEQAECLAPLCTIANSMLATGEASEGTAVALPGVLNCFAKLLSNSDDIAAAGTPGRSCCGVGQGPHCAALCWSACWWVGGWVLV